MTRVILKSSTVFSPLFNDMETDYEAERLKTIAQNRALLDSLGFDAAGTAKLNLPTKIKPVAHVTGKKRKSTPAPVDREPRRRSGRLAGLEASAEEVQVKLEEEEKEREALRVVSRKVREVEMRLGEMVEDAEDGEVGRLEGCLTQLATGSDGPEAYPSPSDDAASRRSVAALRARFANMALVGNAKVTPERIYALAVHPTPTKTLVFAGDKAGMLGIWDAPTDESDPDPDSDESRVWHVQAHARNSIPCVKVDPAGGAGLFTAAYDCTLRQLDFATLVSREMLAMPDEDTLVSHFDLAPTGHEAWVVDTQGGITHCDFRARKGGARRWVVQDEGRGMKIGGVSVNPTSPHLICTASNDQHLRIWDTRKLLAVPALRAAPLGDRQPTTHPHPDLAKPITSSLQASFQHGKSCSAAYWDPSGTRILTTSYDDRLRIFSVDPGAPALASPKVVPHNCQTGRWLTILRAQWSLNTEYAPHFTVGNMKRSLDVIAATGERIVSLWADPVTAVPAVTASHPGRVDRVVGGNTSGRVQLWASTGDA